MVRLFTFSRIICDISHMKLSSLNLSLTTLANQSLTTHLYSLTTTVDIWLSLETFGANLLVLFEYLIDAVLPAYSLIVRLCGNVVLLPVVCYGLLFFSYQSHTLRQIDQLSAIFLLHFH